LESAFIPLQHEMNRNTKYKRWAYVYHVSPESGLRVIRPQGSPKQSRPGIYVAPKFKNVVAWFVSYVTWKKGKMKTPKAWQKDPDKPSVRHHESPMYYQEATIYKLRVPKEVLERSWSENSWEKEYFIIEDDLPIVEIVSSKTYRKNELNDLYQRQSNKSYEARAGRYDPMRAAKELHLTNLAAKEWLRLKDVIAARAMKGGISNYTKKDINILMSKLQNLFTGDWFWDKERVERLSLKQEAEAQKLVKSIESLLGE
jgi:hypothetical protein